MKKIISFLKKLWSRSKFYIDKYVHPSVLTVEAIKAVLDSPAVPLLMAIIPGQIDDLIIMNIRRYLPDVLKVLGYADDCLHAGDGDAIFQCAIKKIKLSNDTQKDAAYHNIATLLSVYLSDGKLSWREAIHLSEMVLHEKIKQAA